MKKSINPVYGSGKPMDPRLPDSYRTNEKDKRCGNCIHRKQGKCSKWNNAHVMPRYMCDAWKG